MLLFKASKLIVGFNLETKLLAQRTQSEAVETSPQTTRGRRGQY
jgi:hypothetical protein